ncbi:MAG: hypothetical protein HY352_02340 [Candidatus Omnitrophica bacterium]|nr:hypothetical protein [Candidatus Omnitrophota bacterium]
MILTALELPVILPQMIVTAMNALKRLTLVALIFGAMVGHRAVAAATEEAFPIPAEPQMASPDDAMPDNPELSTANIERLIQQLHVPIETGKVNDITFAIQELDDEEEQAHLEQVLNERLAQLGGAPLPSRTSMTLAPEPESSNGDLQSRIEMLNLGSAATVEDLRARDQIVSDIAGLTDPVERERLLQVLQQHEHDAASE